MYPLLIARTQERESCSEENVSWVREFRIVRKENAYALEDRYLSHIGDKWYARKAGMAQLLTDPETTWREWTTAGTPQEAIWDAIGDTSFQEAISLSTLHADAVKRHLAERAESDRRYKLENELKSLIEEFRQWKFDEQRKFDKKYRDREGEAFNKVFEKTKKRLKPIGDEYVAKIEAAKSLITWRNDNV